MQIVTLYAMSKMPNLRKDKAQTEGMMNGARERDLQGNCSVDI